jgi:hypothetical protein
MIKKLVVIVAAVVLLLVLAVVIAVMQIDRIARTGVEVAGTKATGVTTTLEDIKIGLFRGEVGLKGLKLANPAGYDAPHFMHLGSGEVAVTLGTLMEDKVVVPKLHLDGIDVHLVKKDGKANYEVILENMKTQESAPPTTEEAQGKKFVIQELLITNVTVHASMLPLGGSLTKVEVKIPEIRLQNVGSDSDNGALLKDVSGTIIKAVLVAIAKKGAGILPESILGGLENGLAGLKDLGDVGMKVAGEAVDTAKALAKDVGKVGQDVVKGAGDAGKGVVEGAGKALEGVGNIFKKNK